MHVEECCQSLLNQILPELDRKRSGFAIDIGVGTFAFYCKLFKQLRFKTVAVEPVPTDQLRQLCHHYNIQLVESCISDINGFVNLHIGTFNGEKNLNLNSMRSDWWGSTSTTQQVQSILLSNLLNNINAKKIACIKIDVEGLELSIIKQFLKLKTALLPKVLIFEYGGGGTRESRKGGWKLLEETIKCLEILRSLDYRQSILVDSTPNTKERVFNLQSITLKPAKIFPPQSTYGNIIVLRDDQYPEHKIASMCQSYQDNKVVPPPLQIQESLFRRTSRKFRQILYK
ncbi:MAG: FkbM family methyltransferase [Candidatus Thorarchaeota archaeon]